METSEPLPNLDLDGGWCIGEDSFQEIERRLSGHAPRVILEYGSGASSVRLALAFPDVSIVSVEHDPQHVARTCALREAHRVGNLRVLLRPLRIQVHGLVVCRSYEEGWLPDAVDAIIIDGPPSAVFGGREACLYQAFPRLRVGGIAILDDCRRTPEQLALGNWHLRYPGAFDRVDVEVGHGLCVLTKNAALSRSVVSSGSCPRPTAAGGSSTAVVVAPRPSP